MQQLVYITKYVSSICWENTIVPETRHCFRNLTVAWTSSLNSRNMIYWFLVEFQWPGVLCFFLLQTTKTSMELGEQKPHEPFIQMHYGFHVVSGNTRPLLSPSMLFWASLHKCPYSHDERRERKKSLYTCKWPEWWSHEKHWKSSPLFPLRGYVKEKFLNKTAKYMLFTDL